MSQVSTARHIVSQLSHSFLLLAVSACGSERSSSEPACVGPDCREGSAGASASPGGAGGEVGASADGTSGGAGANGNGGDVTSAPITTNGPHFSGSGSSFRPLTAGCGPETAGQCTGSCEQGVGSVPTQIIRPPATLC